LTQMEICLKIKGKRTDENLSIFKGWKNF
jgi:hypothetical protein